MQVRPLHDLIESLVQSMEMDAAAMSQCCLLRQAPHKLAHAKAGQVEEPGAIAYGRDSVVGRGSKAHNKPAVSSAELASTIQSISVPAR